MRSTATVGGSDRLFPAEPSVRALARELHGAVADAPIISPHGHVPVEWIVDDVPFRDATQLLITPDHYVTRLLHSHGVRLESLGVGVPELDEDGSREAFRILAGHWPAFLGTPMSYWMEEELSGIFGVSVPLTPETADAIYDEVTDKLAQPEYRPRRLLDRFGVDTLATTDDPVASLDSHARLAADVDFVPRVLPTFRPDVYLEPGVEGWAAAVAALGSAADTDTSDIEGFAAAMRARRAHFRAFGAVSTDHSHADAGAEPLGAADAGRLYRSALAGPLAPTDAAALRRHFVFDQARMAAEDGLVMTIHPSIWRDYDPAVRERFGPNVGADIPLRAEFVRALHPLLTAFGSDPRFRLVAFTADETVFSTELAPLAGFYPALHIGAPWWFIDAPDAISRYYAGVVANAGLGKLSGFIDDTRALCSIPARHDMNRRVTASFLAGLVAEHRISLEDAAAAIVDLTTALPRRVFSL